MFLRSVLLLAALCVPAFAQTTTPVWVKVATEANTLTVATVPITVRYGASSGIASTGVNCATSNCWAVVTITKAVTNISLNDATCCVLNVADPAMGIAKELDVQQSTTAITVTVSGKAVTVPALPPPPPQTVTYLLTVSGMITVPVGAPMPTTLSVANPIITVVKQ